MKNKDSQIDNSIKFDTDLVVSEVQKDPFEDYDIVKTLGEGSFGKVYLVKHKTNKVLRAMKIIPKID